MADIFAVRYFCGGIFYRKVVAWMIGEARGLLSLRVVFFHLLEVCDPERSVL